MTYPPTLASVDSEGIEAPVIKPPTGSVNTAVKAVVEVFCLVMVPSVATI